MRFAFILLVMALGACVAAPPTAVELEFARKAVPPSNGEAGNRAVERYFRASLKDPDSARFTFREPRNGVVVLGISGDREIGWFICGTINARNSYGGYAGPKTFLAHFSPVAADIVTDGGLDDPGDFIIENWCESLYGS